MFFKKRREERILENIIKYLKDNGIDDYKLDIKKINYHKYIISKQHTCNIQNNDNYWDAGYEEILTFYI